jgi:UDP-N-acetyl-D-glucosamine dehydrogenase
MEEAHKLIDKFQDRSARIGVCGLGYAGLPLALSFAESGFEVRGFDVDAVKIEKLRRGESYIGYIPADRISRLVVAGSFKPEDGFEALRDCDAAIICVPTPLGEGRAPDLSYVRATARDIAKRLHRGQLVVLESTTYPGTTDEVVLPILAESGLKCGEDFFLAFSPEREDPANKNYNLRSIPKVIGGVTPKCGDVAAAAYSAVVQRVVRVSSARVAEAAKLLEQVFRCVNIAMINELKMLFQVMGIDLWEVINAAATKPFGFMPFYPGPGLGGHCIPIDPFYLTWKARQYDFATRFIELAGEINTSMPQYVVDRLAEGLNLNGKALKDAEVLLIGVAYKRDVDDVRESPALAIIKLLKRRLARVAYHDPYVAVLRSRHLDHEMHSVDLTADVLARADAVLIVTDHSNLDYDFIVEHARLVVDSRNATARCRDAGGKVIRA